MPTGFVIPLESHTYGPNGSHIRYPAMTKAQAEAELPLQQSLHPDVSVTIVPIHARYVGCDGCVHQTEARKKGCLEPGITSDNCLRARERV